MSSFSFFLLYSLYLSPEWCLSPPAVVLSCNFRFTFSTVWSYFGVYLVSLFLSTKLCTSVLQFFFFLCITSPLSYFPSLFLIHLFLITSSLPYFSTSHIYLRTALHLLSPAFVLFFFSAFPYWLICHFHFLTHYSISPNVYAQAYINIHQRAAMWVSIVLHYTAQNGDLVVRLYRILSLPYYHSTLYWNVLVFYGT